MYVETWSHFKTVLTNIRPALTQKDKLTCNIIIVWIGANSFRYHGINEKQTLNTIAWLIDKTKYFEGISRADIHSCVAFCRTLNNIIGAWNYKTEEGCIAHNFFFYDNACHKNPKLPDEPVEPPKPPKPPPPEKPPEEKPPDDYKTKRDCVAAGFYWWDNACHKDDKPSPPPPLDLLLPWQQILDYAELLDDYLKTIPLVRTIERGIVKLFRNWLRVIGAFLKWQAGRK